MATAQGLADIAKYAKGIGPSKGYVIPVVGSILDPATTTSFVQNAHAAGLVVHPYTYRVENTFLPINLRIGTDPNARGDLQAELKMFLDAGIGVKARDAFVSAK